MKEESPCSKKKMQNDTAISSCISLCNHHLHEANECFI